MYWFLPLLGFFISHCLQNEFVLQSDLNRGMKRASVKLSDYNQFIKLSA